MSIQLLGKATSKSRCSLTPFIPLLLVLFSVVFGIPAARAQTVGSPMVYYYTGSNQTYTVGANVTTLQIQLWGAGGAGSGNNGGGPGPGGGGGYVSATLAVTPGQVITLLVGGGGLSGAGGYGGGGSGVNYGGGGRSGVILANGTEVLTAGAGGGGSVVGIVGGAGGGLVGMSASGNASGRGGTQTAGGAAGTAVLGSVGTAGSFHQGGNGNGGVLGYAGGGSGHYGGGAGEFSGGGGSSYFSSAVGDGVSNGSTIAGMGGIPANNTSIDYVTYGASTSVGTGGGIARTGVSPLIGGAGMILFRPVTPGNAEVPEPNSLALIGSIALGSLGVITRRRSKKG